MTSSHTFTGLNRNEPFRVLVHWGEESLAGARCYRQYRQSQGYTVGLDEKVKENPELRKLIGASHVYVFGGDGIGVRDVVDWHGLATWLLSSNSLSGFLDKDDKELLVSIITRVTPLYLYQKRALVGALNRAVSKHLPIEDTIAGEHLIARQFARVKQRKDFLKYHASQFLGSSQNWGQAVTPSLIEEFQDTGLENLWIGWND